jgi:hypothetical protein
MGLMRGLLFRPFLGSVLSLWAFCAEGRFDAALEGCRTISDSMQRLACFDQLASNAQLQTKLTKLSEPQNTYRKLEFDELAADIASMDGVRVQLKAYLVHTTLIVQPTGGLLGIRSPSSGALPSIVINGGDKLLAREARLKVIKNCQTDENRCLGWVYGVVLGAGFAGLPTLMVERFDF